MPMMMLIGNLNYVVIAVVGALRVSSGSLSLGEVQAFIQYTRMFTQPITQIASMANLLQSGVASAERVFESARRRGGGGTVVAGSRAGAGHDPRRGALREGVVLVRRGAAHRGPLARRAPGPDGRDRRPDRRRQDHPGQPDHAVLRDSTAAG
nr:hypothetical protein [Nocardioides convexus]